VSVQLAAGTALGGDAAGDVLIYIENLTGSAFADALFGDTAVNVLRGLDGNDWLKGFGATTPCAARTATTRSTAEKATTL
jgi:hypothetical protein